MEFPHLGKHCNELTCNRLDFLPMKCDSCNKVFCSSHFYYEHHACPGGHRKDVQVPVCPLCGEPVPTAPGVEPDLTVGQHIDKQCKSDTKKIFTNRCSYKSCKRKELIPVKCSQCNQNYCLRHRHSVDHECRGPRANSSTAIDPKAMAAKAAEQRQLQKPTSLFDANLKQSIGATQQRIPVTQRTSATQVQSIQGNMTEDEALARALALSVMEFDENADRNRRNATAARTQTVPVGGRDGSQENGKDKCSLS